MSIELINAIRKLGWPDSNDHWQYGNAAILCYLSCQRIDENFALKAKDGEEIIERFKDLRVTDLVSRYA